MERIGMADARGGGVMSHGSGRGGRALGVFLAAVLAGCATSGDLQNLRYEVRVLSARQDSAFEALRRVVDGANAEALDSVAELARLLFELRGDVSNRLLAIQDQQLVMGELVGQSQYSLAQMTEELNAQRRQIERVSRPMPADTVAGREEEAGEEPSEGQFSDADEEAFAAIVEVLDMGLTGSARRALETFLEEYPNSDYAPAAYLHLAELRALDDELDEAIDAYLTIPDLFPDAEEVPRALFQAGLLCIAIGEGARAREYLQRLIESYPDHALTPRARERLEAIP